MTNNEHNLVLATEIAGSYLTNLLKAQDIAELKQDPSNFITVNTGVPMTSELEINIVDNTEDTLHLALPYYTITQENFIKQICDDKLKDIDGGEIFITLGALIGFATGSIVAGTLALNVGIGTGAAVGAVLGASIGAGVVGSAVAGGVAGTAHERK